MKTLAIGLCAIVALSAQTTSAALMTPISQSRTISASADGSIIEMLPFEPGCYESDRASDSATDFGPFNSSVSVEACVYVADATASQTSNILDTQITGIGEVEAGGSCCLAQFGTGDASSSLSVAFQISQTVTYSFEGQLMTGNPPPPGAGLGDPISSAFFRLRGPNDNDVFSLEIDPQAHEFGTKSLIISGPLTAGEYALEANVRTGSGFQGLRNEANFDFDFNVIPEPTSGLLFTLGLPLLFATCRRRS